MNVLIYQEKGRVGQYHVSKKRRWIMEYVDQDDKFINPTTASVGAREFNKPLFFDLQEVAIDYAKKQNFNYEVVENPEEDGFFSNSYTKNFI